MWGQNAKFWNTMPMPRSLAGTSFTISPLNRVCPSSGA
jgi:hypothetical protein